MQTPQKKGTLAARSRHLVKLLFPPTLSSQGELVQLRPRLPPCWVVLPQDGEESFTVSRLDQVDHLVSDDIFEKVLRFCHKLRIEAELLPSD